jgi:formate-dependent phosphoribosylglycinamide formyltransferase (GAR transformylase)
LTLKAATFSLTILSSLEVVKKIAKTVAVYPGAKSLFTTQHRGREKALFDQLNIPCAPYQMVNSEEDLKQAVEAIGLPAILKTATEGYDGKGQFLLHDTSQITQAWNSMHLEFLTKQYGRIESVSGSVQNSDPGLQILIFYLLCTVYIYIHVVILSIWNF